MPRDHVKEYVKRVASVDFEEYPEWDITRPLPRLPVPDLYSSCEKYLLAVKPVISEQEYEKTCHIVEEFRKKGGEGEALHEKLKQLAIKSENWAYDYWLTDMYMRNMKGLPVNSNPGMVLPREKFEDDRQQIRFAARLISGILDYKKILEERGLPVDRCRHKKKGQPLCMEQYYRLFSTYRYPGETSDKLVTTRAELGKMDDENEHIIVACRNQFFVLDVVVNTIQLGEDDIYAQLRYIKREATETQSQPRVGILTSMSRDQWARNRAKLLEDPGNRASLEQIEQCMFVLCLDQSVPPDVISGMTSGPHQLPDGHYSDSSRTLESLAEQMLHGSGSKNSSCNRWYDKTMQFVVSEDGNVGLNYEHSPSEGIAVIQLVEHMLKYMYVSERVGVYFKEEVRLRKLNRMSSICDLPRPDRLLWTISPHVKTEIDRGIQEMDRLMEDMDLYVHRFTQFGRDFPKTQNMSPDSFIQLALQLTYYKCHGKLCPTYESASIRRFVHGRVDNIRSASIAVLAWVKAMVGENKQSDEEKMSLLRKAMDWQTEILTYTILGRGFDLHLLALKELAAENGGDLPEMFADPVFKFSNYFMLSTSQVPTTMDAFMCYGAVVENGYGASYNPHKNSITTCVTSFKSSPETDSEKFSLALESSFLQMHELCLRVKEDKNGARREEMAGKRLLPASKNNSLGCGTPLRGLDTNVDAAILANGGAE